MIDVTILYSPDGSVSSPIALRAIGPVIGGLVLSTGGKRDSWIQAHRTS